MKSPFGKNSGPVLKCKRDTHDLSFQSNATYKFGYLYPAFVKEASAGDSWHINPSFGLRFLPTYFPLQTKINAKLDFFYVRYRNLWKDWKNYRYGTGNPSSFPVLSKAETVQQSYTGSLGDYMGLPTTLIGDSVNLHQLYATVIDPPRGSEQEPTNASYGLKTYLESDGGYVKINNLSSKTKFVAYHFGAFGNWNQGYLYKSNIISTAANTYTFPYTDSEGTFDVSYYRLSENKAPKALFDAYKSGRVTLGLTSNTSHVAEDGPYLTVSSVFDFGAPTFYIGDDGYFYINKESYDSFSDTDALVFVVISTVLDSNDDVKDLFSIVPRSDFGSLTYYGGSDNLYQVIDAPEVFTDEMPYEVSAMPFRAYEQIYNAFYRDNRNNPLLVNGVYDPNVFLPTDEGGIDSTEYRLHRRNWEQDFLTSAMPSPQYGSAPLVGISSNGVATLTLDDGTEVQSKLEYDENDKITGFSTTSANAANRTLIQLASSGISINDLRGVNSMQKYLELHWRRGLRYKDQMLAHRGINISEQVLDMPEFIGSVVQRIDVSQINQTAPSSGDPLGSYAGQLSAVGGGNKMTKYCDEDGLIIGILSIVPVPAYSQLLPKHFTKINDPLEYFDPSFRNLGMQAIPYREVCPLQAANSGVSLDSTFGYNRAWYDYLQSQDEIHGQFRTTLNNYVLARVFNTLPSLNERFLTVFQEDLNDVFSVSEVTLPDGTKVVLDVVLGQLHFNVSCERQIPRYALPSLD